MHIPKELLTLSTCLFFFGAGVATEAHGWQMSALAAFIFAFVFAIVWAVCTSTEEQDQTEANDEKK